MSSGTFICSYATANAQNVLTYYLLLLCFHFQHGRLLVLWGKPNHDTGNAGKEGLIYYGALF